MAVVAAVPLCLALAAAYHWRQTIQARNERQRDSRGVVLIAVRSVDYNAGMGIATATGAGTGIVLTDDGEVLTDNHVIAGATDLKVTDPSTGRQYSATVAGYSIEQDLALLKLHGASGLTVAPLGDSGHLRIGQHVAAVGNADGNGRLVLTHGSVISVDETTTAVNSMAILTYYTETMTGLIKSDAPTVGGDSGGPLLDDSGRVVGIDVSGSEKIGVVDIPRSYSMPIDRAQAIVAQIHAGASHDTVHVGPTPFLGLITGGTFVVDGVTEGCSTLPNQGDCVQSLLPDGPASALHPELPFLLTSIAGQTVNSHADVVEILNGHTPGQSVQVQWLTADGKSHTGTVTLTEGPPL
jgi:S1-C subfamily serine protease